MKSVCYKCKNRSMNCHSTCKKYIKEFNNNRVLEKEKLEEVEISSYQSTQIYKNIRRTR